MALSSAGRHKLINDPVHGMVNLPGYVRKVLNTSLMQRLRNVKQVGNLHFAWPSAVHTRYAHSCGTAHLALEYSRQLGFTPEMETTFVLASLMHDIGHGPFSHTFEAACDWFDHDRFRFELLLHEDVQQALPSPEEADRIKEVWLGEKSAPPKVRVMHTLLAGVAGVDRMDYLLRDLYHTRPQKTLDASCVQSIIFNTSVDYERGVVIYTPKGCRYISHLLDMRSYLYQEVYTHPKALASDYLIEQAFKHGAASHIKDLLRPDKFPQLTDATLFGLAWDDRASARVRSFLQRSLNEHKLPTVKKHKDEPATFYKAGYSDNEVDLFWIECSDDNGRRTPVSTNFNKISDVCFRGEILDEQ